MYAIGYTCIVKYCGKHWNKQIQLKFLLRMLVRLFSESNWQFPVFALNFVVFKFNLCLFLPHWIYKSQLFIIIGCCKCYLYRSYCLIWWNCVAGCQNTLWLGRQRSRISWRHFLLLSEITGVRKLFPSVFRPPRAHSRTSPREVRQ